ncbi:MAG TPA: response regulator [Thermoanaerobaculia bacterium]|jgi:two-component system LytT family response regulator
MPIRAIVVDDDDLSVRHLLRLIERWKGTIEVVGIARDGEYALSIIEAERPDVVFLDIDLPLLNGFEVCEQLVYRAPIVFVTASTEHRKQAEQSGALAYLCKPIGHDDVEPVIEMLQRRALNREPRNKG